MKITRYFQSCLKIDFDGSIILIDLGKESVGLEGLNLDDIDALFFTHRHGDHFDAETASALARTGTPVYANDDVCSMLDAPAVALQDGEEVVVGALRVRALALEHFPTFAGEAGPPNLGYLVNERFLHPGDSLDAPVSVPSVAAPISGPSVSFADGYRLARQVSADLLIPIHYDVFVADPSHFASLVEYPTVVVLAVGESIRV